MLKKRFCLEKYQEENKNKITSKETRHLESLYRMTFKEIRFLIIRAAKRKKKKEKKWALASETRVADPAMSYNPVG